MRFHRGIRHTRRQILRAGYPACRWPGAGAAVLEAGTDPLPEAVSRLRSGKPLNSRQVNALCTRSGGIIALARAGFFNPR